MSGRHHPQDLDFGADFVDAPAGRLLVVRHFPPRERLPRAQVLLLGPFAEELNRARLAMAALARALAGAGIGVHVADLSGTGDSEGRFAAATWTAWLRDIEVLRAWCAARHDAPLWLAGLRTGALLAAQSLHRDPAGIARLLCIEPVARGETFLNQLLRVRVANAMARGTRESTKALWTRLRAGEPVEVAGYALDPALAEGLAGARLAELPPPVGLPVDWYEIAAEDPPGEAGGPPQTWPRTALRARRVSGAPFWQLQIPAVPPRLPEALGADFAMPEISGIEPAGIENGR